MVKLGSHFRIERGSSHSEAEYSPGEIPFVSSTERLNGVASYVTPFDADKVFPGGVISISCFGHAFYQPGPFLPKANGGSAVTVLTPSVAKNVPWLIAFCAVFNQTHKWRFGFGRMAAGQSRLDGLELDGDLIERIASQVKMASPKPVALEAGVLQQVVDKLRELYGDCPTIGEVFELKQGKATAVAYLAETGNIPVVSATEKEVNAVTGYLFTSEEELMPAGSISVAKDGKPGVARVQPVPYRATEHALALIPKDSWLNGEKLVLAALIERQCWRFSFARAAGESRLSALNLLDGFLFSKPDFPQPNPDSEQ